MRKEVKPFDFEWEYREVETPPTVRPRRRGHVAIASALAGLVAGFGFSGMVFDRSAAQRPAPVAASAPSSPVQSTPDPWTWRGLPVTPDGAEQWLDQPRLTFDVHDLPTTPDAAEHWLAGQ